MVVLVLVGFFVWFALQLLAQNGRIAQRLDALEQAVLAIGVGGGASPGAGHAAQGPIGAGLGDGGLPVGSPAPEFELPDADGARLTLASLFVRDRSPRSARLRRSR